MEPAERSILPFGIDGDTALILAIVLLLYKQGADKSLIFALLFILF